MRKFGYTEEMIHTRLIENMTEKQESHEKLSHTKKETIENDIIKLSTKMISLGNKMLDSETKLEQFRDGLSNTPNEEDNFNNIVQILLYDKDLFDNFPNKDQVEIKVKKYGKEVVLDGKNYYFSDLEYETSREKIIQGISKRETIDMVDIKHRKKSTKYEICRKLNERRLYPDLNYEETIIKKLKEVNSFNKR